MGHRGPRGCGHRLPRHLVQIDQPVRLATTLHDWLTTQYRPSVSLIDRPSDASERSLGSCRRRSSGLTTQASANSLVGALRRGASQATHHLNFRCGSSSATIIPVATIPQKELRNNVGDVLRRAEAGEELTITVAGRPTARLIAVGRRQWVSGDALRAVWQTPAPRTLASDVEQFPAALADPFAQ
jgi:prevent-host-death family protein